MSSEAINLICPECKTVIGSFSDGKISVPENCPFCDFVIQSLQGVPVLRYADNKEKLDFLEDSALLPSQNSRELQIPLVQEAFASDEWVLELGAGVDRCDHGRLVKSDAYLYSTDLHCLADAHALPFDEESFGYVFSLAMFEHLHSPWIAADEIFRVLKPGGKVYVLTAFMQHMHGYPNHYFNMTTSGLSSIFNRFVIDSCSPSQFSNITELAYILCDFNRLLKALPNKQSFDHSRRAIDTSTRNICAHISSINDYVMSNVETVEEVFRNITPAVEVVAIKPNS